jgi:transposase
LSGAGYEFERNLSARIGDRKVDWRERVLVIRSYQLAEQQDRGLEKRLKAAEAALLKLAPGKGKKVYENEVTLKEAADKILGQHQVDGLLSYQTGKQEELRQTYQGPGRPAKGAAAGEERVIRYQVSEVKRNKTAIIKEKHHHGWRIWVTNRAAEQLPFSDAYLTYRKGWLMERGFHLVKDKPLGIRPLHVRDDEQIRGLTYLLTIALRVMSLIEIQVRKGIAKSQKPIKGLYPGQPKRISEHPTAKRLLQAIARTEINLTRIHVGNQTQWHLTPLPQWIKDILTYLKLSESTYGRLTENST